MHCSVLLLYNHNIIQIMYCSIAQCNMQICCEVKSACSSNSEQRVKSIFFTLFIIKILMQVRSGRKCGGLVVSQLRSKIETECNLYVKQNQLDLILAFASKDTEHTVFDSQQAEP